MIGIFQNKEIDEGTIRDAVDKHWQKVEKLVNKEYAIEGKPGKINLLTELNNRLDQLIYNQEKGYKFKDIVTLGYEELLMLKKNPEFERVNAEVKKDLVRCSKGNPKKNIIVSLYEEYRKKHGIEFVENLHLNVCPYCNRNYINSGKNVTMAQIDHFFSKKEYPLLALSFYNMVPSCYSCNHTKLDSKKNIISPYDKSKKTDDIIKFAYGIKSISVPFIEVEWKDRQMSNNIEVFHLQEQYRIHTDIVNELRVKVRHDPPEYIDSIKILFKGRIDTTSEEIYFGTPLTQNKYYKRPLSKFQKDIINQIKQEI